MLSALQNSPDGINLYYAVINTEKATYIFPDHFQIVTSLEPLSTNNNYSPGYTVLHRARIHLVLRLSYAHVCRPGHLHMHWSTYYAVEVRPVKLRRLQRREGTIQEHELISAAESAIGCSRRRRTFTQNERASEISMLLTQKQTDRRLSV